MPTGHRKYRKVYKSYPHGNGSRSAMSKADEALRLARSNKARVENKGLSVGMPTTPDSTGAVTLLTAMIGGLDSINRIGRKIFIKSVRMRGHWVRNAVANNTGLRLVIIRDNLGNTTRPTITEVYGTVANFVANFNTVPRSQQNIRFTVLADLWLILNEEVVDISNMGEVPDTYRDVKSACYFNGTAATDEGKGALYLFTASTGSSDPTLTGQVILQWSDS